VAGSRPSGRAPLVLCEALTRRLGRPLSPVELGLAESPPAPAVADWGADALNELSDLRKVDTDVDRRLLLSRAVYSVAALALPAGGWWPEQAARGGTRGTGTVRVGRGDVEAVREMVSAFSRIDQRHGGGHARAAVAQFLTGDVGSRLQGAFADEGVRRDMFSAASELAYLCGWMAFDNVTERIGLVIRSVADAIMVAIGASVIAPVIAAAMFVEGIWSFPSLAGFERGLPYLIGVVDEGVAGENVVFRNVAEVKTDIIRGDEIAFETILVGLLDEEPAILAANDVADEAGAVELLQDNAVPAIGGDDVSLHQRLTAEHQGRTDRVSTEHIRQKLILMRIHIMDAETGIADVVSRDDVVVGIGEIHAVALVLNVVIEDAVSLGFPEVNAIASSGRGHRAASNDEVASDRTVICAAQIDPKCVVFDAAIFHCDVVGADENAGIQFREITAGVANHET